MQTLIHSRKVHTAVNHSPLSSEADEAQDYRGFHNLIMLLLFVNNIRLIVENYLKYGLLIKVPIVTLALEDDIRNGLIICALLPIPIIIAVLNERIYAFWKGVVTTGRKANVTAASTGENTESFSSALHSKPVHSRKTRGAKKVLTAAEEADLLIASQNNALRDAQIHPSDYRDTVRFLVHLVNILCLAVLPNVFCFYYMADPLLISGPCFLSLIYTMKLISYALVNGELYTLYREDKQVAEYSVQYPQNLSFGNMAYFVFAPTLCYQPSYPRSEQFRVGFFFKRVVELLTLLFVQYFIMEQYSLPTLRNSLKPVHELNMFGVFERVLKLSIPSIYIWLCMFYAVFHSYLNMWAELLRFGDREFYKPWWNASTIAQYWRLWNIPVYTFFKRHVYVPFRYYFPRSNRGLANALAFFLSSVGHEVLVGVPTHIFKGWAFGGMMFQVPLIWLTEVLHAWEKKRFEARKRSARLNVSSPRSTSSNIDATSESPSEDDEKFVGSLGNYVFWITFCVLGQPLIVLLYYREWYIRDYPELVNQALKSQ